MQKSKGLNYITVWHAQKGTQLCTHSYPQTYISVTHSACTCNWVSQLNQSCIRLWSFVCTGYFATANLSTACFKLLYMLCVSVYMCSATVYICTVCMDVNVCASASIIQPEWSITINISFSCRNLHVSMILFSYCSFALTPLQHSYCCVVI